MKKCQACGKTYDDSWQQCLNCEKPLVFTESGISNEEYSRFERVINERFQRLEARLEKIEAASGIVAEKHETPKYIKLKEVAPVQAAKAQSVYPSAAPKKQDIESTIGLVWLNRIGVVALLFGAAFFLKYAFDNHWIGETARVVLGLAAGLGLVTVSEAARKKKYETMSQGLHGAGVGILYLSAYAAFGFYHLIPAMAAFALLTAVTLYCGFWSVKADWRSSAIIGIAGGFLTPFLIGFNKIDSALLLSYLVLLDLGVLYISFYRGWRVLNVLSLALTHLVFLAAPGRFRPEAWMEMTAFATAYFAIFSVFPITRNLVRKEKSDGLDALLVLLNGVIYFGHLYPLLEPHLKFAPGILPLALSALYVGYAYSALSRAKDDKGLILTYVGLAVLFITLAVPIQFDQNWITISWAVEAAVLCWIGFRIGSVQARRIAAFIGIISLCRLLWLDFGYEVISYAKCHLIWNERTLTYLVSASCLIFAGRLYKKYASAVTPNEKRIPTILFLSANILFLAMLCLEAQAYFTQAAYAEAVKTAPAAAGAIPAEFWSRYRELFGARELTISILWILYALADIAAGIRLQYRPLRITALAIFGIAILKIFFFDLSQLDRIYRIISFIGLGAVLMLTSFFYQKYKDRIAGLL